MQGNIHINSAQHAKGLYIDFAQHAKEYKDFTQHARGYIKFAQHARDYIDFAQHAREYCILYRFRTTCNMENQDFAYQVREHIDFA